MPFNGSLCMTYAAVDTRQTVVQHNRNGLHWRELNEGLFWPTLGCAMLQRLFLPSVLQGVCMRLFGVLACPWPQKPQVLGYLLVEDLLTVLWLRTRPAEASVDISVKWGIVLDYLQRPHL